MLLKKQTWEVEEISTIPIRTLIKLEIGKKAKNEANETKDQPPVLSIGRQCDIE